MNGSFQPMGTLQFNLFKNMQIFDTFIWNETSENAVSVKMVACPPNIISSCGDIDTALYNHIIIMDKCVSYSAETKGSRKYVHL